MKVGLLRHFRVNKQLPKERLIAQADLLKWFEEVEEAEVDPAPVEFAEVEFKKCYASDLPRALNTATHVFPGEVIPTPQLREVKLYPLFRWNMRLPLLMWAVLTKAAFTTSHKSQLESPARLSQRVEAALDQILSNGENTLIVSHGLVMVALKKELKRRGFQGPEFRAPLNGKLYLYEK